MIRYRIEMPRLLRDLIRHLPPELKAKVKAAMRSISDDPHRANELSEELAGLRSGGHRHWLHQPENQKNVHP